MLWELYGTRKQTVWRKWGDCNLKVLLPRRKWSKQSKMSVTNKYDTQLATRQAFLQIFLFPAQGFEAVPVAEEDSENYLHLALTATSVCLFVSCAC